MRHPIACILAILCTRIVAQSSVDPAFLTEINAHRQQYKNEFISDKHSPLTARDTGFLDFFPPDPSWRIAATVKIIPQSPSFDMLTYSGQKQLYRRYAALQFDWNGQVNTLNLYQNLMLIAKDSTYFDYLFLPFKDLTNGGETYGGGRYLDFRMRDIENGVLILDFNKNYNPYCAYSDGYSCPIPPRENHLDFEIRAGEKEFRKEKKQGKH
ncbi:MAG: DUF1684 domain-containing protein [Saprospiraceae bacterium]|nr:DUF1684 domain-containing protein [Saprospiraceae bacterium]